MVNTGWRRLLYTRCSILFAQEDQVYAYDMALICSTWCYNTSDRNMLLPALGESDMIGRIHSIETMGALDGPGLRYVLFFQGCPCRGIYCHNPDTWDQEAGMTMSTEQVMEGIAP